MRAAAMPDAWCRLSTFWVITAATVPRATRRAIARCPSFGWAPTQPATPEKARVQASRRFISLSTNSSKVIGFIRLQTPPGLLKSGMPDSVEMPAPVNTTARRASAMGFANLSPDAIAPVLDRCDRPGASVIAARRRRANDGRIFADRQDCAILRRTFSSGPVENDRRPREEKEDWYRPRPHLFEQRAVGGG